MLHATAWTCWVATACAARAEPLARAAHHRCGAGAASFSPASLFGGEVLVLDARPAPFGGPHLFNPSAVPLPEATRHALRGSAKRDDDDDDDAPFYLVAFRYRGGFCELLCGRDPVEPSRGIRAVLCLYGETFRELACLDDDATTRDVASGAGADYGSYDIFLKTLAGRIYATSVLYGHKRKRGVRRDVAEFRFHSIDLDLVNGTACARKRWIDHPDVANPASLDVNAFGKNLGVVWDGAAASPFSLLHWLDRDFVDVRRGVPPVNPRPEGAVPLLGLHGRRLHHNGSPLGLDARCPGLRLSFGHVHTDEVNATELFLPSMSHLSKKRFVSSSTREPAYRGLPPGTVYVHYLVLWQTDPPHRVVATSRPFCFPSLDAADACDLIQFVSGYAIVPGTSTLLVTYGINDCLSARIQVSVEDALALAFRNQSEAARRWCPLPGEGQEPWPT